MITQLKWSDRCNSFRPEMSERHTQTRISTAFISTFCMLKVLEYVAKLLLTYCIVSLLFTLLLSNMIKNLFIYLIVLDLRLFDVTNILCCDLIRCTPHLYKFYRPFRTVANKINQMSSIPCNRDPCFGAVVAWPFFLQFFDLFRLIGTTASRVLRACFSSNPWKRVPSTAGRYCR